MAFNDIKAWREIMDADEQERLAYDKACEDAEARAAARDRREYDEIEQAQIDVDSLGCCGRPGCTCLDDLEDDEIDFSAYGVSESDLGVGPADENYPTAHDLAREPLVRIPAAMGRPASDADLAAQDVVRLMMEAFKKALAEKKKEEILDEDYEFEESEDEQGEVYEDDGVPEKVEAKVEDMAKDDDYPLSDDDWKEILAEPDYGKKIKMIQDKVGERWANLSAEAKRQLRVDIDQLRQDLLRSRYNQMKFKEALRLQRDSRTRELSDEEKKRFSDIVRFSLTPEQIGQLDRNMSSNGYRVSRLGRKTRVPASDAQSQNVVDHHRGEDQVERRNETGLDSEFDPEKFQYSPEPMTPGEEIPADFDPDFPGSPALKTQAQQEIDRLAADLKPGHEQRKKDWLRRAAADLPDGDEELMKRANDVKVWKKVVGALDPEEIQEIEQELMDELPFPDHIKKIMLNSIFHSFKVTRQDLMSVWGVAGDQKGSTGMMTQNGDKEINALLIGLAEHLNICQDEVTLTARSDSHGGTDTKHYGSKIQAFRENLRAEGTLQRERRKLLRPMFLEEILAELDFNPASVRDQLGATPSYSMGRKEKAAADKLVLLLLAREWDQMTAAEHQQFVDNLRNFSERTEVRKLKTGLDARQNDEFQQLIARMRDEGDIPDEDRIRLMQLDIMRKNPGTGEDQARASAERAYQAMVQEGPNKFPEYTTRLAKEFLRGKSSNITKDTITAPDRTANS